MGQMGIQVDEICQLKGSPGGDATTRTWLKMRFEKHNQQIPNNVTASEFKVVKLVFHPPGSKKQKLENQTLEQLCSNLFQQIMVVFLHPIQSVPRSQCVSAKNKMQLSEF